MHILHTQGTIIQKVYVMFRSQALSKDVNIVSFNSGIQPTYWYPTYLLVISSRSKGIILKLHMQLLGQNYHA